jgi:hypothetical protein
MQKLTQKNKNATKNKKLSHKKTKIIKLNKNMKGGARIVSGFVKIVKYLYDINEALDTSNIDYTLMMEKPQDIPAIIDYVDNLGNTKSILARWMFSLPPIATVQPIQSIILGYGNPTKIYTDFDKFTEMVMTSLEKIEDLIYKSTFKPSITQSIDQIEHTNLSMLAIDETGLPPYYLLERETEDDSEV